jgi:hypothetical protein
MQSGKIKDFKNLGMDPLSNAFKIDEELLFDPEANPGSFLNGSDK